MSGPTKPTAFLPLEGLQQTRVLLLDPGSGDDALSGTLSTISLDRVPSYEALSYAWGQPELKCKIRMHNNMYIYITESLRDALRDLRHERFTQTRTLWADGVCINQEDMSEREQQVALMGAIYRSATRVITYVGPKRDNSSAAVALAQQVWLSSKLSTTAMPAFDDERWEALKALVVRPWSNRCWCAHEFLLNRNLIMACGRDTFDWQTIPYIVQLAFNKELPSTILPTISEDPDSLKECLTSLLALRESILAGYQINLHGLLRASHMFKSSNPRDKVYSLLGVACDREKAKISIDYQRPVEDLYVSVAKYIITSRSSARLDLLYACLHQKTLNLPSWVPDWSTWKFGTFGLNYNEIYAASGKTASHVEVQGDKLAVSGVLFDRITWLSEEIKPKYEGGLMMSEPTSTLRREWVMRQKNVVEKLHPYPDGSSPDEVLSKTLIGNATLFEIEATADYTRYFDAHLAFNATSGAEETEMAREFCDAVRRRSRYRRLGTTKKGYLGAVPEVAEVGDWVCMFHGGQHLFVVRENGPDFTYVGHAYIHGLMKGEILKLDDYESSKRMIVLA